MKMPMEDQKLKKRWVKALRSGRYTQGTGRLRYAAKYCCLGVLCEIAKVPYDPASKHLPDEFRSKVGIHGDTQRLLETMNDGGRLAGTESKTFKQIARWIEVHL